MYVYGVLGSHDNSFTFLFQVNTSLCLRISCSGFPGYYPSFDLQVLSLRSAVGNWCVKRLPKFELPASRLGCEPAKSADLNEYGQIIVDCLTTVTKASFKSSSLPNFIALGLRVGAF